MCKRQTSSDEVRYIWKIKIISLLYWHFLKGLLCTGSAIYLEIRRRSKLRVAFQSSLSNKKKLLQIFYSHCVSVRVPTWPMIREWKVPRIKPQNKPTVKIANALQIWPWSPTKSLQRRVKTCRYPSCVVFKLLITSVLPLVLRIVCTLKRCWRQSILRGHRSCQFK